MGIENRSNFEGEKNEENPDEVIIFQDGNRPGIYLKGKRSEMQLLVDNWGGYPLEEKDPKLNDLGQIWGPTEWSDSGKVIEFGWRDVMPIPEDWQHGQEQGS